MSFLGGGAKKVDTSAYDRQIEEANRRAEEARKAAEEAAAKAAEEEERRKQEQLDLQNQQLSDNKARRASVSDRFSLLLFEDDSTLG